jgi:hypothetical protein
MRFGSEKGVIPLSIPLIKTRAFEGSLVISRPLPPLSS